MTTTQEVTLIVAILGVLHGPLIPALIGKWRNRKRPK